MAVTSCAAVLLATPAAFACEPTIANGSTPPGEHRSGAHHGNGALWLGMPRRGEYIVSRTVNDRGPGLQSNGTIRTKHPWWGSARAGRRLKITGRTLEGSPARLTVDINQHSQARSPRFWPTYVTYPRAGCWRITGRAGKARLRVVILVRLEDPIPEIAGSSWLRP